jgi:hypothetical protein
MRSLSQLTTEDDSHDDDDKQSVIPHPQTENQVQLLLYFVLVGYITTLSVSGLCSIECRMTDEPEGIWKEVVVI